MGDINETKAAGEDINLQTEETAEINEAEEQPVQTQDGLQINQKGKKILIVIIKDIGDVMLCEPVLQILKYNFPDAKIDVLAQARCAPVLENNPYVNEVVIYDNKHPVKSIFEVRKRKYHWVIDYLSNPRSAMICALSGARMRIGNEKNFHKFYAYNFCFRYPQEVIYNPDLKLNVLRQLGLKWPDEHAPLAKYYLNDEQRAWAKKFSGNLRTRENQKLFAFYVTPKAITKKWPDQHFQELARLLHSQYDARIIVLYGPGEFEAAQKVTQNMPPYITLAPKTNNLYQFFALLSALDLLVGCCGGTKHMALAVGVPTVTIHTVNHAEAWTPSFSGKHLAVRPSLICSPCFRGECETLACMQNITPAKVFDTVKALLDNIYKSNAPKAGNA